MWKYMLQSNLFVAIEFLSLFFVRHYPVSSKDIWVVDFWVHGLGWNVIVFRCKRMIFLGQKTEKCYSNYSIIPTVWKATQKLTAFQSFSSSITFLHIIAKSRTQLILLLYHRRKRAQQTDVLPELSNYAMNVGICRYHTASVSAVLKLRKMNTPRLICIQ